MSDAQTPPSLPARFWRDEDGNITLFSVFMVVLILAMTGAAVDVMRQESLRSQMQGAMDRGVLAAADLDQLAPPNDVVKEYMTKAGVPDALTGVQVEQSLNHRVVAAQGFTDLDTHFMRIMGYDTLGTPVMATAEERIANVEISLVLDISGSMRYNDRMVRMKPAAQNFVDKVLVEDGIGVTTLNVIPFAGHVNPGDILFDYFRGERPNLPPGAGTTPPEGEEIVTNFFPPWEQAISNVVMYFDIDGNDVFDRAHKIEGFPENAPRDMDEILAGAVGHAMARDPRITRSDQFLGMSIKGGQQTTRYFQVKGDKTPGESDLGPTNNNGKIPGETFRYTEVDFVGSAALYTPPQPEPTVEQTVNMPSSCIEIADEEFFDTAMPAGNTVVPHFHFWPTEPTVMDWGWCPEEDTAIHYYSSDREGIKAFIEDIRMHDGTGLHIGTKYGLSLLDPVNRAVVSHLISAGLVDPRFEGRPIDWNDPETEKYLVIMTDGKTTDQYRPNDPTAAINGEVELQGQGSGAYHNASRRDTNIAHLLRQCDLARSLGVKVFTIAYDTDNSAADDMRACASSESHFFHVHGAEIWDAFDTIARQINNLRLIQ